MDDFDTVGYFDALTMDEFLQRARKLNAPMPPPRELTHCIGTRHHDTIPKADWVCSLAEPTVPKSRGMMVDRDGTYWWGWCRECMQLAWALEDEPTTQ